MSKDIPYNTTTLGDLDMDQVGAHTSPSTTQVRKGCCHQAIDKDWRPVATPNAVAALCTDTTQHARQPMPAPRAQIPARKDQPQCQSHWLTGADDHWKLAGRGSAGPSLCGALTGRGGGGAWQQYRSKTQPNRRRHHRSVKQPALKPRSLLHGPCTDLTGKSKPDTAETERPVALAAIIMCARPPRLLKTTPPPPPRRNASDDGATAERPAADHTLRSGCHTASKSDRVLCRH